MKKLLTILIALLVSFAIFAGNKYNSKLVSKRVSKDGLNIICQVNLYRIKQVVDSYGISHEVIDLVAEKTLTVANNNDQKKKYNKLVKNLMQSIKNKDDNPGSQLKLNYEVDLD